MKVLIVVFSVVFLHLAVGNPLETVQSELTEKEINYLVRYGYLNEHGARSQEEIKKAVETLQKFASLSVTGIIDEATQKVMQARRCGHPDIIKNKPKFSIAKPWTKRDLSYYAQNVSSKLGDLERTAEILQFALDKWAPWGRLTFSRKYDHSADIISYFGARNHGDSYPFDGNGGVLAHAFYPGPGIGGDIHFDDDEDWVWPENIDDGTDIYTVAIHELGHSLGLGHSNVQSAIMYPWYNPTSMDQNLDQDDINGMYELYIKNPIN